MSGTMFIFSDDIFFQNFRYLRQKNCLSRRAMSKLLNMSDIWIKQLEDNTWGNQLEIEKLLRISQIYDISLHDLLTVRLDEKR